MSINEISFLTFLFLLMGFCLLMIFREAEAGPGNLKKKIEKIDLRSESEFKLQGYVRPSYLKIIEEMGCAVLGYKLTNGSWPADMHNYIHFITPGKKIVLFVTMNHGKGSTIYMESWKQPYEN